MSHEFRKTKRRAQAAQNAVKYSAVNRSIKAMLMQIAPETLLRR